jgi:lipoprotein-anchoring transpeptidase ErfK/SrfK
MRRGLFGFVVAVAALGFSLFIFVSTVRKNTTCANTASCKKSLSFLVENDAAGFFGGQAVAPPKVDLTQNVLPAEVSSAPAGEKHIYIDLTNQTLTAYEGDKIFMQTYISSGKWFPTPTGEFTIWEKLRATRMAGGQGADYYNLPNVPYVMYFSGSGVSSGRGFGIHGTYWHDNFGHPMSHGCVNMRTIDAEKLYYWADPQTTGNATLAGAGNGGTKITIYGQAPR